MGKLSEYGMTMPMSDPPSEPTQTQSDVHYVTESPDPAQHCSLCQNYMGPGMCSLVMPTPDPIVDAGTCDLFDLQDTEADPNLQLFMVKSEKTPAREQMADGGPGYISANIGYSWEIDRLQMALGQIFGCDEWDWADPYTWHITLAYSDNILNAQLLEAGKVIAGQAVIPICFSGVGVFETPNGAAVYLQVEPSDELLALQKAVYQSLKNQGVVLSPFSNPAKWVAHMTLAYAPSGTVLPEVDVDIDTGVYQVLLSRDDYSTLATLQLQSAALPPSDEGLGPMQEMATWKIGAPHDLTIGTDVAWDKAAATKSVFDAAKFDSDSPDTALARQAFLIYNASAPKLRGSYKLPIAKYSGGKLVVVPEALRNASSRISQVQGVSASVIASAQKVLDAYKKRAGIGGEMSAAKHSPIRMTMISELRGSYPNIPLPSGIDLAALKEITGEDPIFVTLPIGQYDAHSANNRTYRKSAVDQMVEQVNQNRPYGAWGHLKEDEIASKFDPPAVQWLAATVDSQGTAWGKMMPLNKETRDYFRQAKATNSKVATSLFAYADMENDGNVVGMDLKAIDLADPARIGVAMAAANPQLTREMSDVFMRAGLERPAAAVSTVSEQEAIMPTTLTQEQIDALLLERDTLKANVVELTQNNTKLANENAAFQSEIGVLLGEYIKAEVTEQVKITESRDLVVDLVIATQPQSRDQVKEAVKQVLARPSVQKALKISVAEQMGPPQIPGYVTPEQKKSNSGGKTYFQIPARVNEQEV